MYLGWAAYYEGPTDAAYFDVLLPRILDRMLHREGVRPVTVPDNPALRFGMDGREVEKVATEICAGRDAFHLLFVHADTGGRAQAARIQPRREGFITAAFELCGWPIERAIRLSPQHESEAWALADPAAVCGALGYEGGVAQFGFPASPQAAERLVDPKGELDRIAFEISGRRNRRSGGLLTSIAREQSIDLLRRTRSFRTFEGDLRRALQSLGCIAQDN